MNTQTVNILLPKGLKTNSPKKIIIHAMGQFIEGTYAPYFLKEIGLSAHYLVDPSGVRIRCRQDEQGAYHAKGHNTDSLGIEFLVAGNHNYQTFLEEIERHYVTEKQFWSGLYVVRNWMEKFQIIRPYIQTHSEIDPQRKKDPGGGFPLERFFNEL